MVCVSRPSSSIRWMIQLFSATVLLLTTLLGHAWAQTEEDKRSHATGVQSLTAGTTGEHKSGYKSTTQFGGLSRAE